MAKNDINVGIDLPGGDPDDNNVSHLERAINALTRVSLEYEDQPVMFFAYVDKKNAERAKDVFSGKKNVTIVGDIEQEFPMDKKPEEMAKVDTTISRLSKDLKAAEQTSGREYLDVIYSSGQSAAVVRYAFDSCKPLGRIRHHILRPSLTTRMPYGIGKYFYINDVGAYKTTKSIDLFISAILTQIFAEAMYGEKATTIGMLNTPMSEGAKKYFEQLSGYVGTVTPLDAFEGKSKIVAVDGFRGNIFLKVAEAVSRAMIHRVKHATLVQKLIQKDRLLLNKFCPSYNRDGTVDFKTEEYYNTIFAQVRELLTKKPEGRFLERFHELFTRVPGSQKYRMITGEDQDEVLKNVDDVLEKNDFDFRQHIGDKLDFATYAAFELLRGTYNSIITGREPKSHRTPNIAILSNGEEDVKGDNFAQELISLLDENIGFVEPEHLMAGKIRRSKKDYPIDIVVSDKHTAQMYAQTTAAVEKQLGGLFKGILTLENLRDYKKGKGPLYQLKALLNPDGYNGSPILGLNAYALVGHGKASTNAIEAAIKRAVEYRRSNYVHLAHAAIPEMQKIAEKIKPDTAVRSNPE